MLQDDNMDVYDAPADEGDHAPRQSYNFCPGYHGIVYRADVPDHGAGPRKSKSNKSSSSAKGTTTTETEHTEDHEQEQLSSTDDTSKDTESNTTHYKLQSMKWGLIPFWTKRNPDYAAVMKTINCRADSLAAPGGLWASMKGRKRCVVIAQGFYEWLKVGPREKVPHFVKRKDGKLMCMAGLWDCVQYEKDAQDGGEGERHYTYTVITTESNKQVSCFPPAAPILRLICPSLELFFRVIASGHICSSYQKSLG